MMMIVLNRIVKCYSDENIRTEGAFVIFQTNLISKNIGFPDEKQHQVL